MSVEDVYFLDSSFFRDEFLLLRRHPGWDRMILDSQRVQQLLGSAIADVGPSGGVLPVASHLLLKSALAARGLEGAVQHVQAPGGALDLHTWQMLRLMVRVGSSEAAWAEVGLAGASLRQRAEALLEHMPQTRSWLFVHPLDGLLELLRRGQRLEPDPADRSWHGLQLARLLLLERRPASEVQQVLAAMGRGGDGLPPLAEHDRHLLEDLRLLQARLHDDG